MEHVYITYRLGELRVKITTLSICTLIRHFSVVFHWKIVFFIFISFFDEISNFCNIILTNQTPELVIKFVSGTVVNLFQETYSLVHSLSPLRKPYVFQMRIFSLKIFIQTTLFSIFPHVSITYQNYVISKRNNCYVLKITYVLHKLAIFNAILLLYGICC